MSENIAGKVVVITGASSALSENEFVVAGNARPARSRHGPPMSSGLTRPFAPAGQVR
jgi:hypothetical protein